MAARAVEAAPYSPVPGSFNNDPNLYLFNLFFMTAAFFLGIMMVGRQCSRVWQSRRHDQPLDPVATARLLMAKRWIDPIAVACGMLWMTVVMLGEPGIEFQRKKAPLPVDMWSRWPVLVRAGGVLILSFVASLIAVLYR